jgi:beta-lactamase regulating signal transducer with metallopeptidase domain/ketosteroid isomerase-like protein
MNGALVTLNQFGALFVRHAGLMFVQVGILILLLSVFDRVLHRYLRASLRYGLWMLVLVKLALSPSFSLPTGIGTWSARVASFRPAPIERASPSRPYQDALVTAPKPHETTISAMNSTTEPAALDVRLSEEVPVRLDWPGGLLVAWLTGVVALVVALLVRAASTRHIIREARPPGEALLELLARCQHEVGLATQVKLKLTRDLSGPAVCRAWRPVILVPEALTDGLPEEKQRTILIHELCHIKRADPWVNLAQTLLQVFYFYNPLVWLANASIRRVREQAVDERVLVCLKGQLQCYSHTLIDIASALTLRTKLGMGLIGVSESKTRLNERIQLMLHRPTPHHAGLGFTGFATVIALGCMLLPMASVSGQANAALGASFTQADAQTSEMVLKSLGTALDSIIAAANGGRLDAVQSYGADDAIIMPPGETAVLGRDALVKLFSRQLGRGAQITSLQAQDQRIWSCGDLIYAAGPHTITATGPDGSTHTESRMAVTIWKRRADGSLQMKLGAYNRTSDAAAAENTGRMTVYRCDTDSPTLPADDALYNRIRDLDKQVEKMFADKKTADALGQYADGAILMPNGGQIVRGKAALKTLIEQNTDSSSVHDIDMKFAHIEGNEQMVYVVKWCGWKLKNPVSGMDYTIPGKSLHVWQRQADGSWKILLDLNNMDVML